MTRPATARLKCNPPLGRMPTLQFCRPIELRIDPAYQRDISSGPSQALIRRIAQHWNWDLCQPLVVARRMDFMERLFVIDGQHRLEAARLRGDIEQLPCVIVKYDSAADEAASFVHLNQQRRPLSKIDLFKAAVASEDREASAILAAITAAGLSLAPHTNCVSWKPGMIANIGGIEASWRGHGPAATTKALEALAKAWPGEVLQYAGSLFPGIAGICSAEMTGLDGFAEYPELWEMLIEMVGAVGQAEWRGEIMKRRAIEPNLKFARASELVFAEAWRELLDGFFDDEAEVD